MSDQAAEHVSMLWLAAEGEENGPLEDLVFGLGVRYGGAVAIRLARAAVSLLVPTWETLTGGDPYVRSVVELVDTWEQGTPPSDQALFDAMQAHASVPSAHAAHRALFAAKGLINALSGHLFGYAEPDPKGGPPPPAEPVAEQAAHAVKYASKLLPRAAIWTAVRGVLQ